MNLIELLDKLKGTLLGAETAEDLKLENLKLEAKEDKAKEDKAIEDKAIEDKAIEDKALEAEEAEEEEVEELQDPTIQSLQEEIVALSEELASLINRVNEIEVPLAIDEIKETEVEEELKKTKAELAELKEPATEPVITNSKTEISSSFALRMKSSINKQRIKAGYREI